MQRVNGMDLFCSMGLIWQETLIIIFAMLTCAWVLLKMNGRLKQSKQFIHQLIYLTFDKCGAWQYIIRRFALVIMESIFDQLICQLIMRISLWFGVVCRHYHHNNNRIHTTNCLNVGLNLKIYKTVLFDKWTYKDLYQEQFLAVCCNAF